MATRKYNVPLGVTRHKDVAEDTGDPIVVGNVVQVTVDLDINADKREVLHGIDTVARYIRKNPWPPA